MSPAFEQIIELSKELTEEERLKIVAFLQEDDEAQIITEALGDSLREDGSIDFDLLYAQDGGASAKELHEDYPELVDSNGHISPVVEAEHDAPPHK